eukprot:gnl/TRDRNA2_/TRDRNA2_186952_c0_seq1.p1 gnl/TRDRNA2_/TRDRNA2_186952_c0~~gnl/TRDRNA2_/TRDRNA2_186952_c0_seq1.p1  ORF type:complete len:152 (+),score=34.56 gnl/TRDRNA2_/TRDRNA2_186952_c0_seq1:58-456(+)
MGVVASSSPPRAPPPVPIFYKEEFFREYSSTPPSAKPAAAEPPVAAAAPSVDLEQLKGRERAQIRSELREEELSAAEAAAKRLGSWAAELRGRPVPCLAEQSEVERCYASPPGGDQLRCGPVVDAFVRCAKL